MASIEKGKALNSKYLFGTDAELANRNDTGNNPVLDTPPAFSQTKPGNTDANAAAPVARDRSGDLKFGKGV